MSEYSDFDDLYLPLIGEEYGFKETGGGYASVVVGSSLGVPTSKPDLSLPLVDCLDDFIQQLEAEGFNFCGEESVVGKDPLDLIRILLSKAGHCEYVPHDPILEHERFITTFKRDGVYKFPIGWVDGKIVSSSFTAEEVLHKGCSTNLANWCYQPKPGIAYNDILYLEGLARSGSISPWLWHMWIEVNLPVFCIEVGTGRFGDRLYNHVVTARSLWLTEGVHEIDWLVVLDGTEQSLNLLGPMDLNSLAHSAVGWGGCLGLLRYFWLSTEKYLDVVRDVMVDISKGCNSEFGFMRVTLILFQLAMGTPTSAKSFRKLLLMSKPWRMSMECAWEYMKEVHTIVGQTNVHIEGRLGLVDTALLMYCEQFAARGFVKPVDEDLRKTDRNLFTTFWGIDWHTCSASHRLWWSQELQLIKQFWPKVYPDRPPVEAQMPDVETYVIQASQVASGSAGVLKAKVPAYSLYDRSDPKVVERYLQINKSLKAMQINCKSIDGLLDPEISRPISKQIVVVTKLKQPPLLDAAIVRYADRIPEKYVGGLLVVTTKSDNQSALQGNCYVKKVSEQHLYSILLQLRTANDVLKDVDIVKNWRTFVNTVVEQKADYYEFTERLSKALARAQLPVEFLIDLIKALEFAPANHFQKNEIAKKRVLYATAMLHTLLSMRVIGKGDVAIGKIPGVDSSTVPAVVALNYLNLCSSIDDKAYYDQGESIIASADPADFNKSLMLQMMAIERLLATKYLINRFGMKTGISKELGASTSVHPEYVAATIRLALTYLRPAVLVEGVYQILKSSMLSGFIDTGGINTRANWRVFTRAYTSLCQLQSSVVPTYDKLVANRQGRGDDMVESHTSWLRAALSMSLMFGSGLDMQVFKQRLGRRYEYLRVLGGPNGVVGYAMRSVAVLFYQQWEAADKQDIRTRSSTMMAQLGTCARRCVQPKLLEALREILRVKHSQVTIHSANAREVVLDADKDLWEGCEMLNGLGNTTHPLKWPSVAFNLQLPTMSVNEHELSNWVNGAAGKDLAASAWIALKEKYGTNGAKQICAMIEQGCTAAALDTVVTNRDRSFAYNRYIEALRTVVASLKKYEVETKVLDISRDARIIEGVSKTFIVGPPKIGKSAYADGDWTYDIDDYGGQYDARLSEDDNLAQMLPAIDLWLNDKSVREHATLLIGGGARICSAIADIAAALNFHVVAVAVDNDFYTRDMWGSGQHEVQEGQPSRAFTQFQLTAIATDLNSYARSNPRIMVVPNLTDALIRFRPAVRIPTTIWDKHGQDIRILISGAVSIMRNAVGDEAALSRLRSGALLDHNPFKLETAELDKLAYKLKTTVQSLAETLRSINGGNRDMDAENKAQMLEMLGGPKNLEAWKQLRIRVPGAASYTVGTLASLCRTAVTQVLIRNFTVGIARPKVEDWALISGYAVAWVCMWSTWERRYVDYFKT